MSGLSLEEVRATAQLQLPLNKSAYSQPQNHFVLWMRVSQSQDSAQVSKAPKTTVIRINYVLIFFKIHINAKKIISKISK